MNKRIFDLPDAPLPLDPDSYYEVLIPDGSSASGYTSCKIKPANILGQKPLIYKGLITQVGSDPTVHETYSDIGSISFVKDYAGYYKCDMASIFTSLGINYENVIYNINNNIESLNKDIRYNLRTDNVFEIWTYNSGTLSDGILSNTPFTIEIYL